MAQFSRPETPDVSTGGWTVTPLYEKIDEATYSDSDYITSSKNASADICEVNLSAVSDPTIHTGHTVRFRARCDKSSNGNIVATLMQGTTVIRSYDTGYLPTSFTPYSFTLTEGEAQAITDYSGLSLRFSGTCTANAYVFVSWAELEVPDASRSPSYSPSASPSYSPSLSPSPSPSLSPSSAPSFSPSLSPSPSPSLSPSPSPSLSPSPSPSISPSPSPSLSPSPSPSLSPSISPSPSPSLSPSISPSPSPSYSPSASVSPSLSPSASPSLSPSPSPSVSPSLSPSPSPSVSPSLSPSPSPSVSPSLSPSPSPSYSPSASVSPSLSPSLSPSPSPSLSPSPSPSLSPSISPSPSPSASPSISPSISPSPSPSWSPSPSVSPSLSPSAGPGYQNYTRGDYASLPGNNNDLTTGYSPQDYDDVEFDDGVRVDQIASPGDYALHQFKDYINASSATFKCNLQTNLAPSVSTVYLQIYNHNTLSWDTIDSDNASPANADFDLEANVGDLTNYKDGSNIVSCRVYQQA